MGFLSGLELQAISDLGILHADLVKRGIKR